jgi:hypothetical protein
MIYVGMTFYPYNVLFSPLIPSLVLDAAVLYEDDET